MVVALGVPASSVSGSRSDTTYAVVGCSVAVSKFCASVLVAIVDSLSAIFNVLLAMVVSMSLSGTVEANENSGSTDVFSSVVNLKDQFLLV